MQDTIKAVTGTIGAVGVELVGMANEQYNDNVVIACQVLIAISTIISLFRKKRTNE